MKLTKDQKRKKKLKKRSSSEVKDAKKSLLNETLEKYNVSAKMWEIYSEYQYNLSKNLLLVGTETKGVISPLLKRYQSMCKHLNKEVDPKLVEAFNEAKTTRDDFCTIFKKSKQELEFLFIADSSLLSIYKQSFEEEFEQCEKVHKELAKEQIEKFKEELKDEEETKKKNISNEKCIEILKQFKGALAKKIHDVLVNSARSTDNE